MTGKQYIQVGNKCDDKKTINGKTVTETGKEVLQQKLVLKVNKIDD